MGDSFGDVQVHTGPKAAQACDDINASAFTDGNHIAFNSGKYDPSCARKTTRPRLRKQIATGQATE